MKRTPWQRMTLSLLGIIIIVLCWRWSVCHLYTLPEAALAGFVSLTTNSFYVIGSIVIFMVTGRLVYEWSNRTEQVSNVVSEVQKISQDEQVIEKYANKFRDDPSYAPIVPDTEEQFR